MFWAGSLSIAGGVLAAKRPGCVRVAANSDLDRACTCAELFALFLSGLPIFEVAEAMGGRMVRSEDESVVVAALMRDVARACCCTVVCCEAPDPDEPGRFPCPRILLFEASELVFVLSGFAIVLVFEVGAFGSVEREGALFATVGFRIRPAAVAVGAVADS